jgi:nucleoside-diphosphate-sugar epimerase
MPVNVKDPSRTRQSPVTLATFPSWGSWPGWRHARSQHSVYLKEGVLRFTMKIVIAGGHGKIALILEKLLAEAGHTPVGIIRNPAHAADVVATGASALLLDLESTTPDALADALGDDTDAVVFAAGGGPGSGAERKLTVDRDGAILLTDAAEKAGIRRVVILSAMGADDFEDGSDDEFQVYLRAKSEADADLRGRDLDWTVVRPGGLTDDAARGLVTAAEKTGTGTIPRADVASLLAVLLTDGLGIGKQFEVISGDSYIRDAAIAL